jgi:glycosyltransferase involved in cell wall biosynthesis
VKIAVIEPSGRLYGSEYCLLDIIDGLPRKDFEWTVLLPEGRGFDQLLLEREVAFKFAIPRDLGQLSKWRKTLAYARMLRHLRKIGPDLLYVNQAGSLRAASACARWLRLPVVCQVQTLEDARWVSARQKLHRVVRAFICNSQFIAEETECNRQKKCVLYQGVDQRRLTNARAKVQRKRQSLAQEVPGAGPRVIGILGRIALSKGHFLLLEAAQILQSRVAECRFVVIGEGLTPDDTVRFEAAVRQSGLAPRFEFRGYRSDLELELGRLDLLVIPSLAEPLGRVLLDAAEHGVPVVLSDAGGLGELSRRFCIDVPFRSGDANALADAIAGAMENLPAVRERFWSSSLAMFELLSMPSYLGSMERILRNAAAGRSANEVWLGDE